MTALTVLPAVGRALTCRADLRILTLCTTVGADLRRHCWESPRVKTAVCTDDKCGAAKTTPVLTARAPSSFDANDSTINLRLRSPLPRLPQLTRLKFLHRAEWHVSPLYLLATCEIRYATCRLLRLGCSLWAGSRAPPVAAREGRRGEEGRRARSRSEEPRSSSTASPMRRHDEAERPPLPRPDCSSVAAPPRRTLRPRGPPPPAPGGSEVVRATDGSASAPPGGVTPTNSEDVTSSSRRRRQPAWPHPRPAREPPAPSDVLLNDAPGHDRPGRGGIPRRAPGRGGIGGR